jgi:hypothetical protein
LHKEAGFVEDRLKRQNHNKANVAALLAMPRYADVLDDDGEISDADNGVAPVNPSGLVKGCTGWRKELAKWVHEEQDQSDDENDNLPDVLYGRQRSKWLPRSLDLLFGGQKETDVDEQIRRIRRQKAYTMCLTQSVIRILNQSGAERFDLVRSIVGLTKKSAVNNPLDTNTGPVKPILRRGVRAPERALDQNNTCSYSPSARSWN